MVAAPGDYPWSSYRHNALGDVNPILTAHAEYLALGSTGADRWKAYRDLFAGHLDQTKLMELRACLQTRTPVCNDRFREQIEQTLGCKVGFSRRGRPKKSTEPGDEQGQSGAGQLPLLGVQSCAKQENLENRCKELREKYAAGQKVMAELETRQADPHQPVLGISGAIQVRTVLDADGCLSSLLWSGTAYRLPNAIGLHNDRSFIASIRGSEAVNFSLLRHSRRDWTPAPAWGQICGIHVLTSCSAGIYPF
ncbi:MAG: hypothetical protein KBE22_13535, partial [Candidatus Accumulibacter sp.]|nr:hypothetical protein [Accumulibacter sp.]